MPRRAVTLRERTPVLAAVVLAALAGAALLVWHLRVELIVLFAAALFGTALHAGAAEVAARTGVSRRAVVVLGYLGAWLVTGGFFWFAGRSVAGQADRLGERLPEALGEVEDRLRGRPFVGSLADDLALWRARMDSLARPEAQIRAGEPGDTVAAAPSEAEADSGPGIVRLTLTTLTSIFVWAVLVFYLAYDGDRYVEGTIRLFPPGRRDVARDLANALGRALPWWLVGQLAAMAVVALLTLAALLLFGVPLAFTLALIAGVFAFVPYLGPLAAAIPIALITLQSMPERMLWVLGVYGVIQLLESYAITPGIQDRAVSVPPVVLISAQIVMGVLAGLPGVMFATPLVLTLMVVVEVVYLKHGLGEETTHAA